MQVIIIHTTIEGIRYVALYVIEPHKGVSKNKHPESVAQASLNMHPAKMPRHIYK